MGGIQLNINKITLLPSLQSVGGTRLTCDKMPIRDALLYRALPAVCCVGDNMRKTHHLLEALLKSDVLEKTDAS